MNERERKLLIVLGVAGGLLIGWKVIWPSVIKPVFNISVEVEEAKKSLAKVEGDLDDSKFNLQGKYSEYVLRTGGTDPYQNLNDDLWEAVNELLRKSKFKDYSVKPNNIKVDEKKGTANVSASVTGRGKFSLCIEFLRKLYTIPHIIRVKSVKLTPTDSQQHADHDEVKLDVDVMAMCLLANEQFDAPTGDSPRERVKYTTKDVNQLKNWKPFIPYREPEPDRPKKTPEPVEIVKTEPKPPVNMGPPADPHAANLAVRMILRYGVDEVMIENLADKSTEYVTVGEKLDAGTVVLIHTLGVVVHKADDKEDYGYFIYPLGLTLDMRINWLEASEWPEIQLAIQQYITEQEEIRKTQEGLDVLKEAIIGDIEDDEADDEFVGPPVPEPAENDESIPAVDEKAKSAPKAGDLEENKKDEPQPAAAGGVKEKEPVKTPKPAKKPRKPSGKKAAPRKGK